MLPPRNSRRGAKPLMSKPPAAVAPTSAGGRPPDPYPGQSDRVNYYARQMEARRASQPTVPSNNWSGGLQGASDEYQRRIADDPSIMNRPSDGQMYAGGSPDFYNRPPNDATDMVSELDRARQRLDEMNRSGGVTAGPAVTGPNGGIPGLPGYDPNANVQGVGGPQPTTQPMPEIPQRIRSRMVRAAGERPLMGRGYRP